MRHSVASRIAALVMVAGSMLGIAAPVFAAPAAPVNLTIVGGKYTNDTTPTFTWTPAEGATWYEVLLDNGDWQGVGNVSSTTLHALSNGWHTFYVRAYDAMGNVSVSTSVTFEIDTYGPTVPMLAGQENQKTGATAWYSTYPKGESPVVFCDLYENGKNVGGMTRDTYSVYDQGKTTEVAKFTKGVTFTSAGSYSLYARCADADGNYSSSAIKTVTVAGSTVPSTPTTPVVSVAKGTVVKTACDSYAPKSDSCHSIYYYGTDGKRHAFPTESVYMSWFSNYNNVVTIANSTMNAMKVGKNITYRPGTSLVKFSTSSTVYAVDVNQTLRPIMNEAAAKAIYGARWNSYVVTIPLSQRNDYKIGSKIYSSADYSKSQAHNAVKTIDGLWTTIYIM